MPKMGRPNIGGGIKVGNRPAFGDGGAGPDVGPQVSGLGEANPAGGAMKQQAQHGNARPDAIARNLGDIYGQNEKSFLNDSYGREAPPLGVQQVLAGGADRVFRQGQNGINAVGHAGHGGAGGGLGSLFGGGGNIMQMLMLMMLLGGGGSKPPHDITYNTAPGSSSTSGTSSLGGSKVVGYDTQGNPIYSKKVAGYDAQGNAIGPDGVPIQSSGGGQKATQSELNAAVENCAGNQECMDQLKQTYPQNATAADALSHQDFEGAYKNYKDAYTKVVAFEKDPTPENKAALCDQTGQNCTTSLADVMSNIETLYGHDVANAIRSQAQQDGLVHHDYRPAAPAAPASPAPTDAIARRAGY